VSTILTPAAVQADLLPDSRAVNPRAVKRMVINGVVANWMPIFCANCGADGGHVPEDNCTFAFYLCNSCTEKWGAIAGTYCVPDDVFWARLREAQQEKYGRQLGTFELSEVAKDNHNPIAKLIRDGAA